MHVLFVTEFWFPHGMGGGEQSLHLLAKALVKHGVKVSVLTGTFKASGDETIDGVKIHRLFPTASANSFIENLKRGITFLTNDISPVVKDFVEKNNVDVVHYATANASTPEGIPSILHVNSPVPFCPKGTLMYQDRCECHYECTSSRFVQCFTKSNQFGKLENKWYYKYNPLLWAVLYLLYKKRSKAVQKHVAFTPNSDFMKKKLVEVGVSSTKCVTLPNIVPVIKRSSKKRVISRIIFAGALIPSKGIKELLSALLLVRKPYVLDIYGDGPLRDDVRRFIAEHHLSRVTLHSPVPNKELLGELSNADILVQPSNVAEALPRTVLEGMTAGCVIVTSGFGGSGSVITNGKNGVIVGIANPESFAQSLDGVLSDANLRDRLRKEAYKSLVPYREENVVRTVLKLYYVVLKKNHKTFKNDIVLTSV